MITQTQNVKAPTESQFRASLAWAYSVTQAPLCPLHGERRAVQGRMYAVRETEAGGFKIESGSARWNITFTDLETGRSWTVLSAWAKTRRARDGSVRHSYSHKSVGAFGTWADLITALITQQQQVQGVAA